MDHIAIMKKAWGFTELILSNQKTIESRWYNSKRAPWNKVKPGDTVYFKDSGSLVSVKAEVVDIIQEEIFNEAQRESIIENIWKATVVFEDKKKHLEDYAKGKKYCVLIYLKHPVKVEQFAINKKGFGMQASWICIKDITSIKKV